MLLGALGKKWALDRSELAVVYILLLIANTLPARGFSGYIAPIATGATYYASVENNWKETVVPYLPEWAVVQDEVAVRRYYEGDRANPTIPWEAWTEPLAYWLLFGVALYVVMIAVAVIMRRQWMERERLVYPMMQLPLHMLRDDADKSVLRPFFKQYGVWLGFALPCIFDNINALNHYFPYFPAVSTSFGQVGLFRNSVTMGFTLSFTMLGFSFLISRAIAGGLCFFYLANLTQQGFFRMIGLKIDPGPVGAFGFYADGIFTYQAMGAMAVLVGFGLWKARLHLGQVYRRAFGGDPSVDDSGEMLSYRQAVLCLLGGTAIMTMWLWRAGVPLWVVPLLLASCFVVFYTITRVVVEGGVAVMFPTMIGPDFTAAGIGTSILGGRGGAGLATTYVWGTDVLVLLMTACSNGLRLVGLVGRHHRRLIWAILATIVLTILVSLWMRLAAGYAHGAINLNQFYAANAAQYPYRFVDKVVTSPVGPHWDGWIQVGVGGLIMLGLEVLHIRFLWWPLHPLGFPISAAFGSMWFSVFVALILKSAVLKYGGPALYRRVVPFFLGLILGEIVPAGIWLVVDFFTGMQGNVLGTFMN